MAINFLRDIGDAAIDALIEPSKKQEQGMVCTLYDSSGHTVADGLTYRELQEHWRPDGSVYGCRNPELTGSSVQQLMYRVNRRFNPFDDITEYIVRDPVNAAFKAVFHPIDTMAAGLHRVTNLLSDDEDQPSIPSHGTVSVTVQDPPSPVQPSQPDCDKLPWNYSFSQTYAKPKDQESVLRDISEKKEEIIEQTAKQFEEMGCPLPYDFDSSPQIDVSKDPRTGKITGFTLSAASTTALHFQQTVDPHPQLVRMLPIDPDVPVIATSVIGVDKDPKEYFNFYTSPF